MPDLGLPGLGLRGLAMTRETEEPAGIDPVGGIGPAQEARHAYGQAARGTGAALRNTGISAFVQATEVGEGTDLSGAGLDELVPMAGRFFALAFTLAALRPNGEAWLGAARITRLAGAMHLEKETVSRLLDRAPRPPAQLGDPAPWVGRRVPILQNGEIVWLDFFWRQDRTAQVLRIGAFAVRVTLDATGRIEIRGRLELHRLDAVMETERPLPRREAAATVASFNRALRRLRLEGTLTIRAANAPGRT